MFWNKTFIPYYYYMVRKEKRENNHHLVWKSLENEYNVHIPENKIRMDMNRHNALHALFWCLLTPKEQMKEIVCLYDTILGDTARSLLNELLALDDSEFYISWIIKNVWKRKHW